MYPGKAAGPGEPALVRIGSISSGGGFVTPSASTLDALIAGREAIGILAGPARANGGGRDGDFVLRSGGGFAKAVGSLLISSSSWSTANEAAYGGFGGGKLAPEAIGLAQGLERRGEKGYTKPARGETAGRLQAQAAAAGAGGGRCAKAAR